MKSESKLWYRSAVIGVVAIMLIAMAVVYVAWPAAEEPVARSYEDHVWLRKESVTVTATGAAGAAAGSANTDRELHGYVYAVHLDFTSGISATTDITITQASPSLTILDLSNYYTDTWYYPVVQQTDSAGSGTSTYEKVLVQDAVDIGVAQTTSGTVGTVTIYWGLEVKRIMIGVGANRRIWPFVEPPPISPWILDNLGFTINPGDLAEGWSTYREAHKKLFGVGWLSRYWMGYIYPVIRPKRYAELKRAFEEQRLKMQEKFLAAILKATEGE